WEDENGNPFIREIHTEIIAIHPARIIGFNIFIPKDAEPHDPKSLAGMSNEIIIVDEDKSEKYSLHELQHKLIKEHTEEYGAFEKEFLFKGKVVTPNNEVEIVGFKIKYEIVEPSRNNILTDFSEKLLGVVEYLQQGTKSLVFDDHIQKR
ncbi:restriction endonuclease, partial [Acinetobacter baumannii]|nr:restriction endonuclease [Acinetobacter baumannii]